MTLERHLLKEATTLTFAAWKEQVAWVSEMVRTYPNDLNAMATVVRRMGWKFDVSAMAARIAKEKATAKKFKAILATPMMTIDELKEEFPIKEYFEQILKCEFVADQAKCPFHDGKSDTALVVHPASGIWTCFGGCQPMEGKENLTGDVIDAHQRAFKLTSISEAKQSLERLASGDAGMLAAMPVRSLSSPAPKAATVDTELLATVLAESSEVCFGANGAIAADFSQLLLECIPRPEDKPIVFINKKWPIIGRDARAMLHDKPDELQYICSCTAKSAFRNPLRPDDGTNRKANLRERIFLDVEFDEMPLSDQLKIHWWLLTTQKWKLISITFSGSKSYHGLFDVRGLTDEQVQSMESLAKRLGACSGSLRPHQPVRMPGGLRRPQLIRQEIIHLEELTDRLVLKM
jgi:hypothetical protein